MAVHLGTPTTGSGHGTGVTLTHATPAGDLNRALVVFVAVGGGSACVLDVAYGGAAFTAGQQAQYDWSGASAVEVWHMIAPATGAAALVVNLCDECDYAVAAFPVRGVDPSPPLFWVGGDAADQGDADPHGRLDGTPIAGTSGDLAVMAVATRPVAAVTPDAPWVAAVDLASDGPVAGDRVRLHVATAPGAASLDWGAALSPDARASGIASVLSPLGADQPDASPATSAAVLSAVARRAGFGGRGRRRGGR